MMPFSFLTPAFFLGLLGLAVPILIHLTHREKREVVAFPSLMFLQKIPYRSVRRQRIRQWLLFLLRCLAIILLALAFTRPFFEREGAAASAVTGAREIVILLDRSYSMDYSDRWGRALVAARGAVDSIGPEERATLVLFSDRAEAVNQPTSDKAELRAILSEVRLGSGTTRYGPALELAKKILEESSLPRREVVLISDFQKVGWEGQEEIQLPEATALMTVDLSEEETSNVSVTSVVLDREYRSDRERVVASARLTNKGQGRFDDTPVELELGGRRIQEKRVDLAPNSSVTVSFEPFTLPEGISRGRISIGDDPLPKDNSFYFALWPGQSLSVLVVNGSQGGRQSLYLREALAIGDQPSFDVDVVRSNRFPSDTLSDRSVVILNDARPTNESSIQRLREFVERGGGLLVVLGSKLTRGDVPVSFAELLPGTWDRAVDRSTDWGGTLSYLDYSHEVFELFGAPHSGDFSTAKFFRYRPLDLRGEGRVLARFDDGAAALVEKRFGEGRVLVWTSTLDTFWNDLAIQPVYLPFVHQLVKYAAGYAEAEHWHTVGEVLDLSRFLEVVGSSVSFPEDLETEESELVAFAPSGDRSLLSRDDERHLIKLEEQGYYELRLPGSDRGEPASLAVNLDLSESDLSSLDPEELEAAVRYRDDVPTMAATAAWTPEDQEGQQGVWWYLLVVAFVLLAVETFLSNRLSRLAR